MARRGGWRGFLAERDEKSKGAGGGPDRGSVIDLSPERAKQRKEVGSFSGSAVREGGCCPVNTMLFDLKSAGRARAVRGRTSDAETGPDASLTNG